MKRHTGHLAAIVPMAAIVIGLLVSGCCTPRDMKEIKGRLADLGAQGRESKARVDRMDSVMTAAVEANRQMQNDVRTSNQELIDQMNQLLANYNDLMARIDMLLSRQVIKAPLQSSAGAQPTTPAVPSAGDVPPPPAATPNTDCVDAYDNAFTQVRRGEYEPAIAGFRKYLSDCPNSPDIENAYYWIGECYYSQEKYSQAITEYEYLLKTYPNSPNLGRAIYKLARCKQEIGKKDEARTLFQRLVNEFAGTLEAEQAAQRLKDLK